MNVTKKLLLSLGSTAFILVVLEIFIRTQEWGPVPLTYEGKHQESVQGGRIECMNPKVSRFYFNQPTNAYPGCVFYSVNNLGFRNTYPVLETKADMSERVIFVGDSMTYGFGVLEEDTFIVKLEKNFRENGKKVEVINAAEPGAGLANYTEIVKNKILKLHPDILVIGINLNDIIDFPTSLIIEKISRRFAWSIREYSKLVDFICFAIEKNMSANENIAGMLDSYTPEKLSNFKGFIQEMNGLAKKNNSKLYIMVHPIFYDFDDYDFEKIHKDIDQVLTEEKIPFHDFLEDFKEDDAEDLWITKNDQHPNEIAHEKYYEVLRKGLKM